MDLVSSVPVWIGVLALQRDTIWEIHGWKWFGVAWNSSPGLPPFLFSLPPHPFLCPSPPSRSKLEYIITAVPCEPNWLLLPLGHWQQIVCLNKSLLTTHPVQAALICLGCNFGTSVSLSRTFFLKFNYNAADAVTCCSKNGKVKMHYIEFLTQFKSLFKWEHSAENPWKIQIRNQWFRKLEQWFL